MTEQNRFDYKPSIWGEKGWFFLDTIILSYPNEPTDVQKKDFAEFFYLVGRVLPCAKCRLNYNDHLKVYPITDNVLKSRHDLIEWFLKIHNSARISMNKKSITYDEFIEFYSDKYKINTENTMIYNIIYVCIFILLIIGWYKYKQRTSY